MMSDSDLTPKEQETIQHSKAPSAIMTANGTTHATEEATVTVCDLNMSVQAHFLKESPAVLSLGKLCEENGYLHEWHPGQPSDLVNNGRTSRVTPTTSLPWWSQACKQPNTRRRLWTTRSRHGCGRPRVTCGNRITRTASISHGRIDEVILKFDRRLSS